MQKIDDCKAIHLALALLGTTRVQKMFTFETATGDETAYGGVTAYMLSNCKNFMFELLRHVTAPNFPFMSKLPRPPPLYHHHFTTTTLPPPLYHHHFTTTTLPPPLYHHHFTTTTLPPQCLPKARLTVIL
jgi:hypothetical protein